MQINRRPCLVVARSCLRGGWWLRSRSGGGACLVCYIFSSSLHFQQFSGIKKTLAVFTACVLVYLCLLASCSVLIVDGVRLKNKTEGKTPAVYYFIIYILLGVRFRLLLLYNSIFCGYFFCILQSRILLRYQS